MNDEVKSVPGIEAVLKERNYEHYKWIKPQDIVVAEWVRMKCMFGCGEYGRNACCPPNTPSVPDCRRFFDEYKSAVMLHFTKSVAKPEDRKPWSKQVNLELSKLERDVFLAGYQKAFVLFMDSCQLCRECVANRAACKNAVAARPGPEAMAVDVFATARSAGFPIEVLSEYSQVMNRYAILLVE
jgi:predicted metal-binding protein